MSGQLVQKARVPSFQTMLKLRAEKEQRESTRGKKKKTWSGNDVVPNTVSESRVGTDAVSDVDPEPECLRTGHGS